MKFIKYFLYGQLVVLMLVDTWIHRAQAIIFLAPLAIGLVQLFIWIISILSVPSTIVAAAIHWDKYHKSKGRFIVLTIVTWLVIIIILGGITWALLTWIVQL